MLNIYFGDMPEAVYNTSVYFNYTYEDEWLTSDFAKEVIKKIDKSDVKGPHAVESPVLGVISPEKLSGGTKTLSAAWQTTRKRYSMLQLAVTTAHPLFSN